jgi:hypothetical protein
MYVLAWLDDADAVSPLVGGTVEVALAELTLRRRTVVAHPDCGCPAWAPELAADAS